MKDDSTGRLVLEAPAKINLRLRVVRRRPDGFHEIDTRMVPLELADRLVIDRRAADGRGLDFGLVGEPAGHEEIPVDETNLVVRAVRAVEGAAGRALDVTIRLDKRIPSGAGLGGGSSDAAAALEGLDRLFELGIGLDRLAALAGGIGADVPFFLHHGPCDCRGIGEVIEPLGPDVVPELELLLVKPWFGVPTPWAYQAWAGAPPLAGIDESPQVFPWGTMVNDLERPVFRKFLLLAEIKQWLRDQVGVEGALMSGSGSTVFAVLGEGIDAQALERAVVERYGSGTTVIRTRTRG